MQNMNYYYDFSGQKFDYPLSLSINQFDRQVFSRQSSLEISYVLEGSYEVKTEQINTIIKKYELALIAPYDIHMIKPCTKDSIILTVHLDFAYLPHYMVGDVRSNFESMICTEDNNHQYLVQIKKHLGSLLKQIIDGNYNVYVLNHIVTALILILSQANYFSLDKLPLASKNHENYMQAILFIDNHYKEDLRLEDIADTLSFSISYTSRLFKKYAGISFVKYLSMVRVRHSIEALLGGKDSIEEIAYMCGVKSAKAYAQAFKEIYGITPSQYRKQFQNNLKYHPNAPALEMCLDDHQIQLISHLLKDTSLYDDGTLVVGRDGSCTISNIHQKKVTFVQDCLKIESIDG